MKKALILTVTAILLLTLFSACGAPDIAPGVEPAIPNPASPGDTQSAPEKAEFSRGIVDEGAETYISEYLGLQFTLPEGWSFASEEALSALVSEGAQAVYAENAGSMQDSLTLTTVYDMMAVGSDESIAVLYENLQYHIGGVSLTEADYAAALAEQLTATEGLVYTVAAPESAQLAGLDGLLVNASVADSELHQSYFIRKTDELMLVIIFTAAEDPAWEQLKGCFAGA